MDNNNYKPAGSLKCDHPGCGFKIETVSLDDMQRYIDTACPSCGHTLLTQEKYDTTMATMRFMQEMFKQYLSEDSTKKMLNAEGLTDEQIANLSLGAMSKEMAEQQGVEAVIHLKVG